MAMRNHIALARFIQRRLSLTVGDSVPALRVKLGANDLRCLDVLSDKPY